MTARFEFEVDTTHAVQAWEQEVAENIERRNVASRDADAGDSIEAGAR
jgi:3-ketosteroid 9alpha-monooxygenase subunit A